MGRVAAVGRWALRSEYFVLLLTIALFVGLLPFAPTVAEPNNLRNVLSNMWPLLVVAIGQTFVLITAGIDLSQTAIMAVVSVLGAALMTTAVQEVAFENSPLWGTLLSADGGPLVGSGAAVPVGVLAMVVAGTLIGAANGVAVTRLRMPPFMVTLVSLTFFSAVATWLTRGERISGLPPGFAELGQRAGGLVEIGLLAITYPLLIAGSIALAAHVILGRTLVGRWVYAVGTNVETARVSGVPVERTMTFAYAFSGFCAAVGGLLYSARSLVGNPSLGIEGNLLLDIVGATVIGGTSLYGGRGKVLWTLLGVVFFVLLSNGLSLLNLPFYVVTIAKGAVILGAVVLDTARNRMSRAPGPAASASPLAVATEA